MSKVIPLPSETTIVTQPEVSATVTEITVRRMIYSDQQSIQVVTDELETFTVPLTEEQYDGLSDVLQAILVAYLTSIAV